MNRLKTTMIVKLLYTAAWAIAVLALLAFAGRIISAFGSPESSFMVIERSVSAFESFLVSALRVLVVLAIARGLELLLLSSQNEVFS